jgi:saccharopine dehydrogenase (NADP+, L-glutamate forming)/spermidine synthase
MVAMKIIHDIHGEDGKITSFTSHCGVLPAPDANTNPFGYKFSWSPRGVLLALRNPARYLEQGKEVRVPGDKLFTSYTFYNIPGIGYLEGYPNRDSVSYRDKYGIPEVKTLLRGTLRYIGWCDLMKAIGDIGLLDIKEHPGIQGMTYKQFISSLIGGNEHNFQDSLAEHLQIPVCSSVIKKLAWLGLLDDTYLPSDIFVPLDILAERMMEKLQYGPGERDMVVLHHEFQGMMQDKKELVSSIFIDYGVPQGDSAAARTVALPAAIGTKLILQDQISLQGVRIPIHPEIYRPVLQELETLGIIFTETIQPLL